MARAKTAAAPGKKRGIGATLLWGLLGLLILIAGVGSALFYMNEGSLDEIANIKVVKDFMSKSGEGEGAPMDWLTGKKDKADKKDEGGGFFGGGKDKKKKSGGGFFGSILGRSHTVAPGESLWQIAKQGTLVDSPYQWRTIMVQNKDKINFALYSQDEGKWHASLTEGEDLTVAEQEPPPVPEGKRYALQLGSVLDNQLGRAENLVRRLVKDGYFAYVYPFRKEDGSNWYRIRTGFYDSEATARAVGQEIQERYQEAGFFPGELWAVVAESGEQMGEEMAFGVQRVAPWVVQTARRETQREALKALRQLRMVGNFAYIHQGGQDTNFAYHIRIGFYTTRKDAEALMAGNTGPLWEGASITQVWDFEEALPGQTLKLPDSGVL